MLGVSYNSLHPCINIAFTPKGMVANAPEFFCRSPLKEFFLSKFCLRAEKLQKRINVLISVYNSDQLKIYGSELINNIMIFLPLFGICIFVCFMYTYHSFCLVHFLLLKLTEQSVYRSSCYHPWDALYSRNRRTMR